MAKPKASKTVLDNMDAPHKDDIETTESVLVEDPSPPDIIQVRDFPIVEVLELGESSSIPIQVSECASQYDIRASDICIVKPMAMCFVDAGISIKIPAGFSASIIGKRSVSEKRSLIVVQQQLESGESGRIKIGVFNSGTNEQWISVGDIIAVMTFNKTTCVDFVERDEFLD